MWDSARCSWTTDSRSGNRISRCPARHANAASCRAARTDVGACRADKLTANGRANRGTSNSHTLANGCPDRYPVVCRANRRAAGPDTPREDRQREDTATA